MTEKKPLISVVLPAYNEAENLEELFERLTSTVASIRGYDFEFLLIDNRSTDGTPDIARRFTERDARWRFLRFSRNFGAEISLAAGLRYARGECVILMATDLQDPPELIPLMLQKWRDGYHVVYGQVRERQDYHLLKGIGARLAYWLIFRLSETKIPPGATDFRLMTRPVVDALNHCGEQNRYQRGLVHWVGFRQTGFVYDRTERKAGKTTADLLFCLQYAINAIVAFSSKPLRVASYFGLLAMAAGFLGAFVYAMLFCLVKFRVLHLEPPPPGWTTLTIALLLFSGLQSLFLGLLGEYLGNIYREVKGRPLWVVDETAGFTPGSEPRY